MAKGKRISDPNAMQYIQAKLDKGEPFTDQDRKELKKVARLDFIALLEDHGYQLGAAAKNSVENIIHYLINGKGTPRRKKCEARGNTLALRDNVQTDGMYNYPISDQATAGKREAPVSDSNPPKKRKTGVLSRSTLPESLQGSAHHGQAHAHPKSEPFMVLDTTDLQLALAGMRPRAKTLPTAYQPQTYFVNYLTPANGGAQTYASLPASTHLAAGSSAAFGQSASNERHIYSDYNGTATMLPLYNTTAFLMPYQMVSHYSSNTHAFPVPVLPEVSTVTAGKYASFATTVITSVDD